MEKREEARRMALETLQTNLPTSMFEKPIEVIFADHFRQRTLCGLIDEIATSEIFDKEMIEAVCHFMKSEFGPHVLDEEEDLFPLLRMRAEPEDDINTILSQLSEEHAADETDANEIIKALQEMLISGDKSVLNKEAVQLLTRFAANERQHLIVENAIVLPLARVRLTQDDKHHLGQRMSARRGMVSND